MVGYSLLSIAAAICNVYLAARTSQKLGQNLRTDIYSKVIHFTNDEYDQIETSSLITRTTNDVVQIQNVAMMMLRMMIDPLNFKVNDVLWQTVFRNPVSQITAGLFALFVDIDCVAAFQHRGGGLQPGWTATNDGDGLAVAVTLFQDVHLGLLFKIGHIALNPANVDGTVNAGP